MSWSYSRSTGYFQILSNVLRDEFALPMHYYKFSCHNYHNNCARGDTICPALLPRGCPSASRHWARHNVRTVLVLSHAEYVPTLTAAPPYASLTHWVKRSDDLDLWPWKWCPESRATWATSVPVSVFLASVLDLGPMYATDTRQTKASLNVPAY